MDKKVTVIIAAHKQYRMPEDGMYLPVHVGAKGKGDIEDYQRDDVGENISELNPSFCELTGLYWAWKNLKSDYIGLVHYRRHFSMHPHNRNPWEAVLGKFEIEDDLKRGVRIFIPNKRHYFIETLYSHYAHTHYSSQLDATRKIIEERCPDYLKSYDKVIERRWGYMFNMMIMERELLDDYCSWLFPILFELRERSGEVELSEFQGRFYGRVSEIIFNAWLDEKIVTGKLKNTEVKEIPLVHMEKINWWKKGNAFLRAKYMNEKYSGSF